MADEEHVEALIFEPKSGSEELADYIRNKFEMVESSRQDEEERWLDAYRQYRGLYGPDMQFTSTEKSQVFIKITKTKVLMSIWADCRCSICRSAFSSRRRPYTYP